MLYWTAIWPFFHRRRHRLLLQHCSWRLTFLPLLLHMMFMIGQLIFVLSLMSIQRRGQIKKKTRHATSCHVSVHKKKGRAWIFLETTTTIYWLSTDKQNGQIVVQSSHSWTWFCARDMNYRKKARMKSDSALNLEANRASKNLEIFGWVSFLDA